MDYSTTVDWNFLAKLSYEELQQYASNLHLPVEATQKQLISMIIARSQGQEDIIRAISENIEMNKRQHLLHRARQRYSRTIPKAAITSRDITTIEENQAGTSRDKIKYSEHLKLGISANENPSAESSILRKKLLEPTTSEKHANCQYNPNPFTDRRGNHFDPLEKLLNSGSNLKVKQNIHAYVNFGKPVSSAIVHETQVYKRPIMTARIQPSMFQ